MQTIIHIGAHKTGSSAIQHAFHGFDDGESFYANLGEANHSNILFAAFADNPHETHYLLSAGASRDEISALGEKGRNLLKENLARQDRKKVIFSGEDLSRLGRGGAKRLIDIVRDYSDDILVVCYLRDPLSFAASGFQQSVKAGMTKLPGIFSPQYKTRIMAFAAVVGRDRMVVRDFQATPRNEGGVVTDFANICHLKIPTKKIAHSNRSISAGELKLLYLFNRTTPLHTGDATLLRARHVLIQTLSAVNFDDSPIPKDVFLEIADTAECEWLHSAFEIDYRTPLKERCVRAEDWLSDIPPEATDRLKHFLARQGIKGNYRDDPATLMARLYYACLSAEGYDPRTNKLLFA